MAGERAGCGGRWVYLVAASTEGKEVGDIVCETDTPLTAECGDGRELRWK